MCLKKMNRLKIAVFGAGAFGTALALSYSREFDVALFSFFDNHAKDMQENLVNEFLPDFPLPNNISIGSIPLIDDWKFDYIFWAFPIKPSVSILRSIKEKICSPVILCSKGIADDGGFLFDVFESELPTCKIGYLAGPNFAIDLASFRISCADIGARTIDDAKMLAKNLTSEFFKLYPTTDIVGMQICGAVKNIVAIACGIADGLSAGKDMHAALLTAGLDEMKNLGERLGAQSKTFYGFCGVGDLLLTASSTTSRNMNFGKQVAEHGGSSRDVLNSCTVTCEGCHTLAQILQISKKHCVSMPICEAVYQIVFEGQAPKLILNVFN